MIAPCTKFHFQAPHLDPTYTIPVPELISGDSSGEQALIFLPEHLLHLLGRGRQKYAHVLAGYTAVQVEQP